MTKKVFSVTKKDFDIQYFSGTGAGGQHRNRHRNCVRLIHKATGISATGQNSRSRRENLKAAFSRIANDRRFRSYCYLQLCYLEGRETSEAIVDKMMAEENLKIEVKRDGKWTEESDV